MENMFMTAKPSLMKFAPIIVAGAVVAAALFLLLPKAAPAPVVSSKSDAIVTPVAPAEVPTVKTFVVTGSSFKFDPSELTVKSGDTIRITFKNQDGTHNFALDEFNIKTKVIDAGEEETVEFKADKAGTFEYYCSVGTHRAMGMVGKLIVQ